MVPCDGKAEAVMRTEWKGFAWAIGGYVNHWGWDFGGFS